LEEPYLAAILAVASWEISSPEDIHTLEAVLDVKGVGEKFTSADVKVRSFACELTSFVVE
jgi:hypothetical protein